MRKAYGYEVRNRDIKDAQKGLIRNFKEIINEGCTD